KIPIVVSHNLTDYTYKRQIIYPLLNSTYEFYSKNCVDKGCCFFGLMHAGVRAQMDNVVSLGAHLK
ncbi:5084_t:CDS:1, partial [Racocetra persica]